MQTAVQLYSVREAFAEDPSAALQRLADMGVEVLEPYGLPDTAGALGASLAATGLQAPSTHASLLGAEDPAAVLTGARELGITTVIVPSSPKDAWTSAEGVRGIAEQLNALAALAAEHGMRVGYHNHAFELETDLDGRTGLEILAEALDPAVVLELDTYWAAVAGEDPADLLQRLGDRVRLLHLKDGPIDTDTRAQVALGDGAMDIPALLAAAPWIETGVIEFDDCASDVFDGIDRSLQYLDQLDADGGDLR